MELCCSVDIFNDMISSEIAMPDGDEQKLMQVSLYHIKNCFLLKMHDNHHLQNACCHKKPTLVQYFVKMGADVNFCSRLGLSCMHFVLEQNGIDTVAQTSKTCKLIDLLMRIGTSISVRAYSRNTVLHHWAFDYHSGFASREYHAAVLDHLLAHNVPLNVVHYKGNTALMHAAENSSGRFVMLLTTTLSWEDINLDKKNSVGNTCAHLLAQQCLKRRMNCDGINDSHNAHALRFLLLQGVLLSLKNNDGKTVMNSIVSATQQNDALRKVLHDHTVDCMLAFLMGGHRELGSRSYVKHLDDIVLDLVMREFKERLELIALNAVHGTETIEFTNALAVQLGHSF